MNLDQIPDWSIAPPRPGAEERFNARLREPRARPWLGWAAASLTVLLLLVLLWPGAPSPSSAEWVRRLATEQQDLDTETLHTLARHESSAVRLRAVVELHRRGEPVDTSDPNPVNRLHAAILFEESP